MTQPNKLLPADIDEVWLYPRDGYDYEKHLRDIGGGTFIELPEGPLPDPSVTITDSVL
ncbi:MAG: hypothetical protein EZS28_052806, partial [Streblomastix strix]